MHKCKQGFNFISTTTGDEFKVRKGSKWSIRDGSDDKETKLYAYINKTSYFITIPTEEFLKLFEKEEG